MTDRSEEVMGRGGRRVKGKGSRKMRPQSGCILQAHVSTWKGDRSPGLKVEGRALLQDPEGGAAACSARGCWTRPPGQCSRAALRAQPPSLCRWSLCIPLRRPRCSPCCLASPHLSPRANFPLLILLSHARWTAGLLISEESSLFCVSFNQKGFWRTFHLQ